ncbi:MAG: hypothetical protein JWR26_4453 [Pedosphaera sp.]|nr:hypothetical protein [Pedosphaera sp.]
MKAAIPDNENARLKALSAYDILDTKAESAYDDITFVASAICKTPISVMSLVDKDRQWFNSHLGLSTTETPRDQAFCAHTILQDEPLVVTNALADERFADSTLVTGETQIRFYAGVPLITNEGFSLGSLCVIDRKPRTLDESQINALKALGRQVMILLEFRRVARTLAEEMREVKTLSGLLPICAFCKGIRNDKGYWVQVEEYIKTHSDARFTHGVCQECGKKHYPQSVLPPDRKAGGSN